MNVYCPATRWSPARKRPVSARCTAAIPEAVARQASLRFLRHFGMADAAFLDAHLDTAPLPAQRAVEICGQRRGVGRRKTESRRLHLRKIRRQQKRQITPLAIKTSRALPQILCALGRDDGFGPLYRYAGDRNTVGGCGKLRG